MYLYYSPLPITQTCKRSLKKFKLSGVRSNKPEVGKWEWEGWRMVKSETRRDAEILVRNPSPRLFGKKFRDSKKVEANHAKTRLRDLSKTPPRFRDPAKIFRDPHFSWYHSPPLMGRNASIMHTSQYNAKHCTFVLDSQKSIDQKYMVVSK